MAPENLHHTLRPPGGKKAAPGGDLRALKPTSRTKKLAVTFFLLALVAIALNVKFVIDLSPELPGKTGTVVTQGMNGGGTSVTASSISQNAYRNRVALLLGTMVVCFGSIIYLFVTKVVLPLNSVEAAAKEIARGNLGITVSTNPGGEIGALGEVINDLAANYQEILLLAGAAAGNTISAVEKIEEQLNRKGHASDEELREEIRSIRQDMQTLSLLLQDFEFYQAHFDGRKVVPRTPGPEE